jgi:hypothetical protein
MNSKKLKKLSKQESFKFAESEWAKKDLRNKTVHYIDRDTKQPVLKSAHNLESTARRFTQLGLFRK